MNHSRTLRETAAAALLVAAAFAVRFYAATTVPQQTLDEPDVLAHAARFDQEQGLERWRFFSNDLAHPLLRVQLARLGLRAFGFSTLGGRLPTVILGAASVAALYALARALAPASVALTAAGLLAVSQYHIGWSRLTVEETPMLFFSLLSAWLLLRGLRGRSPGWWLASGAAAGLALLCKESALTLLAGFAAYWVLWDRRRLRSAGPYALLAAAAGVVGLAAAVSGGFGSEARRYALGAREWCWFSPTGLLLWLGEPAAALAGLLDPHRTLTQEELPCTYWAIGLTCLAGACAELVAAAQARRDGAESARAVRPRAFLFCLFFAGLIPACLTRGRRPNYYAPFDGFWWAQSALPISMVFAAAAWRRAAARRPGLRWLAAAAAVWWSWHAWVFAGRPCHYFLPRIAQRARAALGRGDDRIMAASSHRARPNRCALAQGSGEAEILAHSEREIAARVRLTRPDILVLPRRFHPDWTTNAGRVLEYRPEPPALTPPEPIVFPAWYAIRPADRGFLAVQLGRPGDYALRLRCRSATPLVGFLATLAALACVYGLAAGVSTVLSESA